MNRFWPLFDPFLTLFLSHFFTLSGLYRAILGPFLDHLGPKEGDFGLVFGVVLDHFRVDPGSLLSGIIWAYFRHHSGARFGAVLTPF